VLRSLFSRFRQKSRNRPSFASIASFDRMFACFISLENRDRERILWGNTQHGDKKRESRGWWDEEEETKYWTRCILPLPACYLMHYYFPPIRCTLIHFILSWREKHVDQTIPRWRSHIHHTVDHRETLVTMQTHPVPCQSDGNSIARKRHFCILSHFHSVPFPFRITQGKGEQWNFSGSGRTPFASYTEWSLFLLPSLFLTSNGMRHLPNPIVCPPKQWANKYFPHSLPRTPETFLQKSQEPLASSSCPVYAIASFGNNINYQGNYQPKIAKINFQSHSTTRNESIFGLKRQFSCEFLWMHILCMWICHFHVIVPIFALVNVDKQTLE
jgi:hypothetical protein